MNSRLLLPAAKAIQYRVFSYTNSSPRIIQRIPSITRSVSNSTICFQQDNSKKIDSEEKKGKQDLKKQKGGRDSKDKKGERNSEDRQGGQNSGERKGGRDFGERKGGWDFGEQKGGRDFGERKFGKDFGEQKDGRDFGERKFGRDFGEQKGGRSFGERNVGRDFGERSSGLDFGERNGGRGFGERSGGRDFGERRGGRDFGEKSGGWDFGERSGGRGFGERVGGRDFGERSGGRGFGERNGGWDFGERSGGRDFGERSGGRDFGEQRGGRGFGDRKWGGDLEDRRGGRDFGESRGGRDRDFKERGNFQSNERVLQMERRAFADKLDGASQKTTAYSREEDIDYNSMAPRSNSAPVRSYSPLSPRLDRAPPAQEPIHTPRRFIQKKDDAAEWIYGNSVVEAALKAASGTNLRRKKIYRLYIYSGLDRTPENSNRDKMMQNLAKQAGVEVILEKDIGKMDSMANSKPHNGYILEALPLDKTPIIALEKVNADKEIIKLRLAQHTTNERIVINQTSDEIKCREPEKRYPFVLMLDEILDPRNLGAILRSAYFLGADAVVVSAKNCAPMSPVCLKAAAGAAEFIPILEHEQGERFIKNSTGNGWTFYAALPPPKTEQSKDGKHVLMSQVGKAVTKGPVVLVIGSEGEGLRQTLVKNVNHTLSIDSAAGIDKIVDSLNVSVASALLCASFLQGN